MNTNPTLTRMQTAVQGIFRPGGGPTVAFNRFKVHGVQNLIAVLDDSGSMYGAKASEANIGIRDIASNLDDPSNRNGFRVSIVTFNDHATEFIRFAQPADLTAVSPVTGRGGTQLHLGLSEGYSLHNQWVPKPNEQEVAPPVFLVMSDGCTANVPAAIQEAERIKKNGGTIVTVGYGSDADEGLLRQIATSPQHYAFCMNGAAFRKFMANVGATLRETLRSGSNPAAALAATAMQTGAP